MSDANRRNELGGRTAIVVGLGEALFDCFDERVVLGGAPINFAVHANALFRGGAVPATAIGDDALGRRFLAELRRRGLPADHVQVSNDLPTGTVRVVVGPEGDVDYDFASDVAWDALAMTSEWERLARSCNAVAFGSLAQRSAESRAAVQRFVRLADKAIRLLDVNLRGDFYTADVIATSLTLASAAKLNENELDVVSMMLTDNANVRGDDRVWALVERFSLDWLAVTRGARGTTLFCRGERFDAPDAGIVDPADRHAERDSVGTGDACSAALVVGMLKGWPPDRIVELANRVGGYVASQPGATPTLPDSLIALTE